MARSQKRLAPSLQVAGEEIGEYGFLAGRIGRATLIRACDLARRLGVSPYEVMVSNGWIEPDAYFQSLAQHSGLHYVTSTDPGLEIPDTRHGVRQSLRQRFLRVRGHADCSWAIAPDPASHTSIWLRRAELRANGVGLASPDTVRHIVERRLAGDLAAEAIDGLRRRFPDQSAGSGFPLWQRTIMGALAVCIGAAFLLAAGTAFTLFGLVLAALLSPIVALRLYALVTFKPSARERPARIPDADLPRYTILVPMFHEADILPDLIISLLTIDWPVSKLDIKLVLEACDTGTIDAVRALNLPPRFEIVIVPDCLPRTKPKALNYALHFATGDYLAIYDAEDRPDPGQLRAAHARFLSGPPTLACVQARLGFYNADENWMTRQFELEYAALFDGLLPALERLGLPIPLGGTSNHFRVSALRWLKGWDAFNVTEDADLGMRLARHGYVCAVIGSRTAEEAPISLRNWTPQRTRWLKGYIQTYAVHMRRPRALWRELGPRRFFGFQAVFGGMVLTSLLHPFAYLAAAWHFSQGGTPYASGAEAVLFLAACMLAALGYSAAMLLALRAVWARRAPVRAWRVLLMPFYWLLISLASWRAVLQLRSNPFLWEKTRHGVSRHDDGNILTLR